MAKFKVSKYCVKKGEIESRVCYLMKNKLKCIFTEREKMKKSNDTNRRDFIKFASVSALGVAAGGNSVLGKSVEGNESKPGGSGQRQKLAFNKNGKFKIVQFTDTHWLDDTGDDKKTEKLMDDIVQFEKPDLIVFTGDNISGRDADSLLGQKTLFNAIAKNKIPWAMVFGNHDDEGMGTRQQIYDVTTKIPYTCCPEKTEDIFGVSNYVLPVDSAKTGQVECVLFMIDSNGYSLKKEKGIDGYGWIMPDQIEWFRKNSSEYINKKTGRPQRGLAFYHIPVPEYKTVWDIGVCVGNQFEKVSSAEINSGFFAAAMEQNNIKGMFVGHDHVNDYEGEFAGVRLCYGRKTGFRSYGKEGFAKGARVIELTEGQDGFDTWLVLEGCERVRY